MRVLSPGEMMGIEDRKAYCGKEIDKGFEVARYDRTRMEKSAFYSWMME